MTTMGLADTATGTAAPATDTTSSAVSLTGDVVSAQSFSLDQLRQLPSVLAQPFDLRCFTTNRFIRPVDRYRGVLLKDLIAQAGLRCEEPGAFKRMIVIAVAHDGYAVTFSWHELFNTPIGEQALIAHECGGQPLAIEDGAPILFSGADTLPAPRHVKRLARIIVRTVQL